MSVNSGWTNSQRSMPNMMRTALPPSWLLCGLLLVAACRSESTGPQSVGDSPAQVELLIDFNGRAENKQFQVDWNKELTAFECLERLQQTGQLSLTSRGTGTQTFVISIDGLENLGAGGDNWIYFVNDRLGDRSAGVNEVQPGDRVHWRFGPYAPK
jgi:hypothetical protein